MSAPNLPSCTCPLGGPFVAICPTHWVADPKAIEFGVSDLPTLRKLASVYTALAEDESVDPPESFVNRVVSQVTTRMVAVLSRKVQPPNPAEADNRFADCGIEELVYQLVGAGSTCWVGGTGDREFDSTAAAAVALDGLARLNELLGGGAR